MIWGTVGISVGITTPDVEENHDMTPAVTPRMAVAVAAFMMDAREAERRWIPPRTIITFISTPTPQIRRSVPQGIRFSASPSSDTRKKESAIAAVKLASPTFTLKIITMPTIAQMPRSVMICALLKEAVSENFSAFSDFSLYPPKAM